MAEGLQKVVVLKENLPALLYESGEYALRYRVISEDKNRFSAWSPIYRINPGEIFSVDGSVFKTGNFITAVWGDELNRPKYQIFVSFDDPETPGDYSNFFYHGTSSVHNYAFLIPSPAPSDVRVVVQVELSETRINPDFIIYDSDNVSI